MTQPADRQIAQDLACPVVVDPGADAALPEDWDWRLVGTSMPNTATFQINHTDVTQVKVDYLTHWIPSF